MSARFGKSYKTCATWRARDPSATREKRVDNNNKKKLTLLYKWQPIFGKYTHTARLNFNTRSSPAKLELAGVRLEDEGDFRCRVDFKRGRTVNTIISLRIVIPPRELQIFAVRRGGGQSGDDSDSGQLLALPHATESDLGDDDDNNHDELLELDRRSGGGGLSPTSDNRSPQLVKLRAGGLIGPFDEDSELELVCQALGGKPRPELSWWRDFRVLNSSSSAGSALASSSGHKQAGGDKEAGISVSLKIPALQRQHSLSIFTCQASNSNLTSPLSSSITLDLNRKFVVRKDSLELVCLQFNA